MSHHQQSAGERVMGGGDASIVSSIELCPFIYTDMTINLKRAKSLICCLLVYPVIIISVELQTFSGRSV